LRRWRSMLQLSVLSPTLRWYFHSLSSQLSNLMFYGVLFSHALLFLISD
jgi:hypothetical protein